MSFFSFLTQELAIDLGTANTLIIHKDKVVVDEPSIIAIERNTGNVIAIGKDAMQMFGKENEGIKTIRPLKDGVIADFQAAEHMIRGMIKMMNQKQRWISPQLKMVICIPSGITEVEKRAVKDSAERSGAKEVYLIHEPMAAAVGIGIDVTQPQGNMIVDIGGGTTEICGKSTVTFVTVKPTPPKVVAPSPASPSASQQAKPPVAQVKKTITCTKGKVTKKVTAVNPKCPVGYKKK